MDQTKTSPLVFGAAGRPACAAPLAATVGAAGRPSSLKRLSHVDRHGRARMVDVRAKAPTRRQAHVQAVIHLSPEAFEAIQQQSLKKGDPFTVAKIAGIQAAKRTAELIPLCHPLPIEHLEVTYEPNAATHSIRLVAHAATTAKTGVELEAFVAAAIGALALYDMVKAIDPAATVTDLQLLRKTGGKHSFKRTGGSRLEVQGSRQLPSATSLEP